MFEIIQGRVKKPYNIIVFGEPGLGKSTFAQAAPDPLFVGAEENDELTAKRFPQVKSFDEFEQQLTQIRDTKPTYSTLVIDSIDSIDMLLTQKILADDSKAKGNMNKAHGGYGAARDIAASHMMRIRDEYLKPIRAQGKNIIIVGHSKKATAVDTVIGLQYDTHEMNLHNKVQAVFVDWCQAVMFATYMNYKTEDDNSNKVFASGTGKRILLTSKRPGHLAKNRFNLPYELAFELEDPFGPFAKAVEDFYAGKKPSADELRASIKGLLENVKNDETLVKNVTAQVEKAGDDVDRLMFLQKKLEERVGG